MSEGLTLRANGGPVAVGEPTDVALSFPAGQGGLDLTRLEADFATPLPDGVTDVAVDNGAFAGRRGWTTDITWPRARRPRTRRPSVRATPFTSGG